MIDTTAKMRIGFINDIGYGICPKCKDWRQLTSFYWLDARLPRKERRRCCSRCNAAHARASDVFFFVKKSISAHKLLTGECDYTFADLLRLHQWQGFQCPYCNGPIHYKFTLEHVVPREHGGRNLRFNILLVCLICNSSKQDYELTWWLEKKGYAVKPKILHAIRRAYDEHGYEFAGTCQHCIGKTVNPRVCTKSPTSPFRVCLRTEIADSSISTSCISTSCISTQGSSRAAVQV